MSQTILNSADALCAWLRAQGAGRPLLICGRSAESLPLWAELRADLLPRFSGFTPNPQISQAREGMARLLAEGCDSLIAIGGGSAMDTAKCIRLWMSQERGVTLPFIAIPTTAGSGSEATRFAVVYADGVKRLVDDPLCAPDAVWLRPDCLASLPERQRKATALDAWCHAVESMWARSATPESRAIAADALRMLARSTDGYAAGDPAAFDGAMRAAFRAGQAINLTRTTAAHALCYGLTTRFGLPHGQAAALCLRALWPLMLRRAEESDTLRGALDAVAEAVGAENPAQACGNFSRMVEAMAFAPLRAAGPEELAALADTVNPERLGNHPIPLSREEIIGIYQEILGA